MSEDDLRAALSDLVASDGFKALQQYAHFAYGAKATVARLANHGGSIEGAGTLAIKLLAQHDVVTELVGWPALEIKRLDKAREKANP